MSSLRPIRLTVKSCASAALALALLSVVVLPAPARAGDDENVPFDTKIIRSILSSLGLKRADEANINYEERPPLVIPSNHSLPPPVKADPAVSNPAWPKDPDVARAKLRKQLERTENSSAQVEHESNPLSPSEMTPGAKYAPRTRPPILGDPAGADGTKMTPGQLGYSGGLFSKMFGKDDKDQDAAKFTGEPPRASLTEPPVGYQTPSPNQPYGQASGPPKAENSYATRGEYK